ncbi:hypothetical protein GLAREA_06813 [Glarea lozoyensis ATCC 20868]|uniref:Uncharacterized protein n=1 Tax=Glarea lozoyensis (strain ATCC 20868 / MF5171) TaxID=1116229 RepID=S3D7U2_GLAL2|nr:uncharacterized protein GLAREA_06813 [Glarea lozoyensis ATCC 20868]EPE33800.1 hypothetical protein GLAREA_06813 [Glarea lozoyensis ATCC 20868]
MRGLRTPSSSRVDLRTADDMDRDVVSRRKSHGRAAHTTTLEDGDDVRDQDIRVTDGCSEFRYDQTRVHQPQEETFEDIVNDWNGNPNGSFSENDALAAYILPGTDYGGINMAYQEPFSRTQPDTVPSILDHGPAPNDTHSRDTLNHLASKPNYTCIFQPPKNVHECMKNLSKLSLDLYEHSIIIPPLSTHPDTSSAESGADTRSDVETATKIIQNQYPANHEAQETEEFPIDDTFHLTTALLDIVCYLNEFRTDVSHITTETAGNSSNKRPQPNKIVSWEDVVETRGDARQGVCDRTVDKATVMLVISCYTRLMDVYECLFGHIKACVEKAILPRNNAGQLVSLPAVRVGSFQVPTSKAIPLQVMTLLQLSSSVGGNMKTLLDRLQTSPWGGTKGMLDTNESTLDIMCKDVKHRVLDVSRQIRVTWTILYQSGLLQNRSS